MYQRADGQWCSSLSLGYDGNGKTQRPGRVRCDEAGSAAEDCASCRTTLAGASTPTPTLRSRWAPGSPAGWKSSSLHGRRPASYAQYERNCRLHVTPLLGAVRLAKLKRGDVVGFYPALANNGVSPAQQRQVGTTLTMALNKAVSLELIPFNPATEVHKAEGDQAEDFPGFSTPSKSPGSAPRRPASGWNHCTSRRWTPGRGPASCSHCCGPTWTSTAALSRSRRAWKTSTASSASRKSRPRRAGAASTCIPDHRRRARPNTARRCWPRATPPSRTVFCDTEGGYLRLSNLRRNSFKPILERGGLPDIRLYDLRHTCATMLLLADVPAKVVSERLGHSSITLTLDIYSHVLPTMQKRSGRDGALFLGQKPQCKSRMTEIGDTNRLQWRVRDDNKK